MPDPALSGASLDLLLGLQNAQGEAAWKLFETLRDNGMTISGPNAQALTPVLQAPRPPCSARWTMCPTPASKRANR